MRCNLLQKAILQKADILSPEPSGRIFVQLRSGVKQQFEKAMETVTKFFKEENDFLYQKGEVKGREEKGLEVVTNLIVNLGLPDEEAAVIAGVSVNYVKGVREGLKK